MAIRARGQNVRDGRNRRHENHPIWRSGAAMYSRAIARMLGLAGLALVTATGAQEKLTNRYVTADKLPWYEEAPNIPVKLARLWGKREQGAAGTLLTTAPGFKSGLHSHTADYWAIVVQGTWQHWVPSTGEGVGLQLEPGAHWTQIHTQLHEDACVSKGPCIIFLFNKDPYVTEFPPQAK